MLDEQFSEKTAVFVTHAKGNFIAVLQSRFEKLFGGFHYYSFSDALYKSMIFVLPAYLVVSYRVMPCR